ncbi:MAG: methyltransferase domain-containing protein [Rhodospirillales bacterium]
MKKSEIGDQVFNRGVLKLHRDRAAKKFEEYDFLFKEVAGRLIDNLNDVRGNFKVGLDIGCHTGQILSCLQGTDKIETLFQFDLSEKFIAFSKKNAFIGDEEFLPIKNNSIDVVLSNLSLHWVNDLPGTLIQIKRVLKKDQLFLASLFGGNTLFELRDALITAEIDILGGASPRVSPFIDMENAGTLLQRAGFSLPVVDIDSLTIEYESPLKLMLDLRGMGEQRATHNCSKKFSNRNIFSRAAEIYKARYGNHDGTVNATFEIFFLTAWTPSDNQQKPLKRGTGKISLAEVFK